MQRIKVIPNKLSKFTQTGRDLRPVRLKLRIRPLQPVKIAGKIITEDGSRSSTCRPDRTGPTHPTLYPLESLVPMWDYQIRSLGEGRPILPNTAS